MSKMPRKILLLLIGFALLPSIALSGSFACKGTPAQVYTWKSGMVGVRTAELNKTLVLCQGSDPGCSNVLATLLTAKTTKKPITFVFLDHTGYKSCDQLPGWVNVWSFLDYMVLEEQ